MKIKRMKRVLTKLCEMIGLFETVQVNISTGSCSGIDLLAGRNILVTGGSRGIGKEIARACINAGAKVIITGRNIETLVATSEELGKKCGYIQWDVADFGRLSTNFEKALQNCSGKIDSLVNNAGIYYPPPGNLNYSHYFFESVDEESYDIVMDTNLKAVYFLSKYAVDYFIGNKIEGHILNIGSEFGIRPARTPYDLSKWGVHGLTQGMGMSLAPLGIIVNGINPGHCATDINDYKEGDSLFYANAANKRICLPEEIANLAVFLLSDYAKNIIGEMVTVDGGRHLK